MEEFIIAVFSSRTQVTYFNKVLTTAGIKSEIISTPREILIGCGLSVKFPKQNMEAVGQIYNDLMPSSFVGFYFVEYNNFRYRVISKIGN
ncbi:MAG: DUF3343 domain-containing protein [Clostridia bacterium]|nr:DUF3343 domain-containing protein [Clostridia bacterium]